MAEVSITTPQHTLDAYLAVPAGDGPFPGVVVLHDVFGMTKGCPSSCGLVRCTGLCGGGAWPIFLGWSVHLPGRDLS